MKKYWIIIIVTIIVLGFVFVILRGQEDTWIKDSRGVWIKHGNPENTPTEVTDQQNLIDQAQRLYQDVKIEGQDLTEGPCLGTIASDWVVDIAHNPREDIDNQSQNQCTDYLSGKAHHFIELDTNGDVVRVQ